jgi:8-oxo-dGTP diphosphatase
MRLYLIRHAHAGERLPGTQDLHRTLSPEGHQRAAEIADLLAPVGADRILSSPATRCVETVQPLALRLGLPVEEQPDLWEHTKPAHVLALLTAQTASVLVACSHGDVIPDVIDSIAADGASVVGRGWAKGSLWILDHDGHTWTRATYVDRSDRQLPELDPFA